nr:unnamed protein product [Digitaria exilis]
MVRRRHGWRDAAVKTAGSAASTCCGCNIYLMQGGNGGAVIDHDGNVTGMAFFFSPHPAVLSISTIMTCIDMWLKFR